jgi:nucleoside-diphosphate-sugar epimerase
MMSGFSSALVTEGVGSIGSHPASMLLEDGFEVTVLDGFFWFNLGRGFVRIDSVSGLFSA